MSQTTFVQPMRQIGRELRFAVELLVAESRLHRLRTQARSAAPPALPDLQFENAKAVSRRKAEAFLLAVRLGAIRH